MTATAWRPELHPRAGDGRFGTVAGQHQRTAASGNEQQARPEGHAGRFVALGIGGGLAGGALVLTGTGHTGRLFRFVRNAMLDDTNLDRVIAGNANLRRLAARMAAGERREVSRYFAPMSHSQALIDHSRGKLRLVNELDADELAHYQASQTQKVRAVRGLIDAADPRDTPPLFRSMYLEQPLSHGDEIDFGPFSSFSSRKAIAEGFGDHLFHLDGGLAPALRLSDSALDEWLVGGRFRILGRSYDGLDWHYAITPVGAP